MTAKDLPQLLSAAALSPTTLAGGSYICTDPFAFMIPCADMPPFDGMELDRAKIERILSAVMSGEPLPPIRVEYRNIHRIRDGHHRLQVSRALGALEVPAVYR